MGGRGRGGRCEYMVCALGAETVGRVFVWEESLYVYHIETK